MYKLNTTLFNEYKKGLITENEYYRECIINFYRKAPPQKNTFFQLKAKENADIFAKPQVQLGVSIQISDAVYWTAVNKVDRKREKKD